MTPYTTDIRCAECQADLRIAAARDDGPRTSTTVTVSCPACAKTADVVVPQSIVPQSVQVVYYQRPAGTNAT